MPLTDAVATGDRREALVALRDYLAGTIVAADPQSVAALSARLVDVLDRLESLAEPEGSTVDDLRARRAKRRASLPPRSGVRAQSR